MIRFKSIKWKNFLSTGNTFTELDLDSHRSTLVIGDNGSGKSTFLDALSFGLYGKAFRKINKQQLLNSINLKQLVVEVIFETKGKTYKVVRGVKPNIFEIYEGDRQINQDAHARDFQDFLEKNIIKMSHKAFSQVVVLGSTTFVPFMQLNAQSRREIIEDLLDLQIFSVMNLLLKDKNTAIEEAVRNADFNVNSLNDKIALVQEHIDELEADNQQKIKANNTKIRVATEDLEDAEKKISETTEQVKELQIVVKDLNKQKTRFQTLQKIGGELEGKIKDLQQHISFFDDHDNCPTCKQDIDAEFKECTIADSKAKLDKTVEGNEELKNEISSTLDKIANIEKSQEEINKLQNIISENNWRIKSAMDTLKALNEENTTLVDIKGSKKKEYAKLDKFKVQLLEEMERREKTSLDRNVLQVVSMILRDTGIKTRIIKQYIPIMNKLINKYLAAMDFFVQFEIDENFNEIIRSRHRDDFTYASFSEGEKMRIDLSLLFTWRAIAKIRNSATTNILIMDEVFDSSLDATGIDEFLKILNELTSDTNVYIISHKGDQLIDKFHNIIKFEKHKNFSRIA